MLGANIKRLRATAQHPTPLSPAQGARTLTARHPAAATRRPPATTMAAGGVPVSASPSRADLYNGGLNWFVVLVAVMVSWEGVGTTCARAHRFITRRPRASPPTPRPPTPQAASGGLLFGYDIGVTGGVTSMASFQQKFFPSVYERSQVRVDV